MDTVLVKFLILWIIYHNVVLTSSMTLKGVENEDSNTREKRSPANNFSLFGLNLGNPVSAARESFSSFGNIFSGRRGNTRHNNYHEPEPYGNVRNTNTLSPTDFPNRSGIPSSPAQDDFLKGDRYIWPQENKSEGVIKPVFDKKQMPNTNTVPVRHSEALENTARNPENGDIDKQLFYDIFQKPQFNYDGADAGTTVDNNINFVTETGEYDSTTLTIRLGPEVVASLLG